VLEEVFIPADEIHVTIKVSTSHHLKNWSFTLAREDDHVAQMTELRLVNGFQKSEVSWMSARIPCDQDLPLDDLSLVI